MSGPSETQKHTARWWADFYKGRLEAAERERDEYLAKLKHCLTAGETTARLLEQAEQQLVVIAPMEAARLDALAERDEARAEAREAEDKYANLKVSSVQLWSKIRTELAAARAEAERFREALEASKEARLATGRQSTCAKQVHGDSHIQCGKCFICLERAALEPRHA